MLQADNISIQYGDECVLEHFSCHVEKGDFTCITGTSGCGKTTLLKAFLGLAPLVEGEVRLGEFLLNESTCGIVRKLVAYLPQDLSLPYDMVNEVVSHVLKVGGLKYDLGAKHLLCVNLKKLGLEEDLLGKRMGEISGGQRQRLMLAVLSLLDREVWLLDEPTAALDKSSRDYVIEFLIEQQGRGKTIVAVSHDSFFSSKCSTIIQLS